jgi:hypothetical protein
VQYVSDPVRVGKNGVVFINQNSSSPNSSKLTLFRIHPNWIA